jgi:hypothetical protein
MNINRIIINRSTSILTITGIACVAVLTGLACDDFDSDAAPSNPVDSGISSNGGNANQEDSGSAGEGGTGGTSGDAGPVCEIDTAAAVNGCEGDVIDIAGEYTDDFGGPVSIGSCSIFGNPVTTLSNDDQYMVTQNSCADPFNPGKWSRNDWTWYAGDAGQASLYYCTQVYDADSEAEAIAAPRADDSDPASSGCGTPPTTFPWSKLTPIGAGADAGELGDAGNLSVDAASGDAG